MKNYTITVNGNVYDVTVEENGAGAAPVASKTYQRGSHWNISFKQIWSISEYVNIRSFEICFNSFACFMDGEKGILNRQPHCCAWKQNNNLS